MFFPLKFKGQNLRGIKLKQNKPRYTCIIHDCLASKRKALIYSDTFIFCNKS